MRHVIEDKYSKIIFEKDPQITIQAINRKSTPPLRYLNFIEDIMMLTKNIENVGVVFYRKSTNESADKIIKSMIYFC